MASKTKKDRKKAPARAPVVTTAPAAAPAATAAPPTEKTRREKTDPTPPKPLPDSLGRGIAARLVERGETDAKWAAGKLTFAGACAAAVLVEDNGYGRSQVEWEDIKVPFRKGADEKQAILSVANGLIKRA